MLSVTIPGTDMSSILCTGLDWSSVSVEGIAPHGEATDPDESSE